MPPETSEQNFSADDLVSLGETPADDGGESAGDKAADPPKADAKQPDAAKDAGKDAGKQDAGAKNEPAAKDKDGKTIATGADAEAEDKAKDDESAKAKAEKVDRNELTEDLRKMIAAHYAGGDKKAEAKELRRLERVKDIKSLWGLYRELEGKFTGGGLIKKPGKDAKPEEIAEFNKAMGVPEKPEDYFKDVKLENGAVIGEADKPLVDGFAAAVHKAGATPQFVNAALNWYYQNQEEQAAAMDEADDEYRRESERALKDEFGPAYRRMTNAIGPLFATAPGGTDIKNEGSLYARLMGGRLADGRIIGNDPDVVRWLASIAQDVNPAATVVEDGNQSGVTIDAEIKQIEQRMKDDRRGYFKDEAAQARYRELLTARDKIRARA
jgi:hypothetical protein